VQKQSFHIAPPASIIEELKNAFKNMGIENPVFKKKVRKGKTL
jgi:hypothetical protein